MQKFNPEKAIWRVRREFGEHGGVTPSISRSSTFTVIEPRIMPEIFKGVRGPEKGGCYLYSRHFNPTTHVLARYLAAMESTEYAICTASGMSAISCALLQACRSGDHIVSSNTVYGGTHALLETMLPEMGITTTFVDPDKPDAFQQAITPATRVLYTEVIGNPTLKIADIRSLSGIARKNNLLLIVDNTFSPLVVTPAVLGADIVVHSLTKFINGASDLIAGVICASKEFIFKLMDLHSGRVMLLGPTMDPRNAFDVIQRIPHLPIRMQEHSLRALAIAARLEELGIAVSYPGLASHPQHQLIKAMHNKEYGFGGIFTIDCGNKDKAEELMAYLQNTERFGLIAVSLGYYDTLMSCSGSSTSSEIKAEEQDKIGISSGLLRISIGYTGVLKDRIQQMERAVTAVGMV